MREAGESAASALNGGYHLAYVIGAALVLASIGVAAILKGGDAEAHAAETHAEPAYSEGS